MAKDLQAKTERRRVPNAERSARTREKLILATIDCLYEFGYHQTTTILVAKRASVSRGAMLHQFSNKAEMMLATAQYISTLRGELHRDRLEPLETSEEKFMALIDILWEAMLSPSGVARIELMLSSRSDPDLAAEFQVMNDRLDAAHKEVIWALCEKLGIQERHRETIESFVQLYAASMRGLAIDAIRPQSRDSAERAVQLLKRFQRNMLDELLDETD